MSRSESFWKVGETNLSPRSGPPHAAADICDSQASLRQRRLLELRSMASSRESTSCLWVGCDGLAEWRCCWSMGRPPLLARDGHGGPVAACPLGRLARVPAGGADVDGGFDCCLSSRRRTARTLGWPMPSPVPSSGPVRTAVTRARESASASPRVSGRNPVRVSHARVSSRAGASSCATAPTGRYAEESARGTGAHRDSY